MNRFQSPTELGSPPLAALWRRRRARRATAVLLLGGLLLGSVACESPALPPDVVASIGAERVYFRDFETYLQYNVGSGDNAPSGEALGPLFDLFLRELLVERGARDEGLLVEETTASSKGPRAAVDSVARAVRRVGIPEPEVKAFYDRRPERFQRPERVRLRQLLFAEKPEARQARQRLVEGEPFEAVSRELAEDLLMTAGMDNGVVLGRADLPPIFGEAVFGLAEGEISEVVEAEYGFHVFQILQRIPPRVEPLELVESQIREELLAVRTEERLEALSQEAQNRYDVRVYERNLPFEYRGSYREANAS